MSLDKSSGIKTVYMDVVQLANLIEKCFIQGADEKQLAQVKETIKGQTFHICAYTKEEYELRVGKYHIGIFSLNCRKVWVYDKRENVCYELKRGRWFIQLRDAVYENLELAGRRKNMICPNCGKEITGNSKYCIQCGADLDEIVSSEVLESGKKKRFMRRLAKILIILAVVFAAFCIICWINNRSREQEEGDNYNSSYEDNSISDDTYENEDEYENFDDAEENEYAESEYTEPDEMEYEDYDSSHTMEYSYEEDQCSMRLILNYEAEDRGTATIEYTEDTDIGSSCNVSGTFEENQDLTGIISLDSGENLFYEVDMETNPASIELTSSNGDTIVLWNNFDY